MSLPIQMNGRKSVSDDSMSSGFGSFEERPLPIEQPHVERNLKRKVETVAELDELLQESLSLSSQKKRIRPENVVHVSPVTSRILQVKENGRPMSRRSCSVERGSPVNETRARAIRASHSGNSLQVLKSLAAIPTDSLSPRNLQKFCSPRRRINLNENNGLYTKHRLGPTFSPMVAGAKKRSSIIGKIETPAKYSGADVPRGSIGSPRRCGMTARGGLRPRSLNHRLQNQQDFDQSIDGN